MDREIRASCDGISIRQAAEEYKVPKSTYRTRDRMSEQIPHGAKSGIEKYLNDEEKDTV